MQLRKVIHISGVMIPVISTSLGKSGAIAFVFLGFAMFLALETLKPKISNDLLCIFYKESELKCFSIEPLSYFISILSLLLLSFFIDERICFTAIAILAAGDGFAGVMGKRYGRHRLPFNRDKSWEGSISGFIAASLAGFYFAGPIAVAGSFFGMLAGAVNKQDNIAVPYTALISMVIINVLLTIRI